MSQYSSFDKTLQFITSTKLQELEKQRQAYHEHLQTALEKANAISDPRARAEHLLDAITTWKGSGATAETDNIGEGSLHLANLKIWLSMCDKDPSLTRDKVHHWIELLERHLHRNTLRFNCAKLFGELLNEWIGSGDSATEAYQSLEESPNTFDTSISFIEVGRKELHDQREKLEAIWRTFFSEKQATTALKTMRESIGEGAEEIWNIEFSIGTVDTTISSLLASGLMSEEKCTALRSFSDNSMILGELVDVLKMRLSSIDTWAWPAEGLLVEMRRYLNGKYRAFTDPDLVDAILLHHVGLHWQVKLKKACRELYSSKAWKNLSPPTPNIEKQRYNEQLPDEHLGDSINARRSRLIDSQFFLTQLANSVYDINTPYDDTADDLSVSDGDYQNSAFTKQNLLYMMLAECYFNTAAHGSFAIIRSDFEWFGPSIPHETILTVLEFFGVPLSWLKFFKTFLRAPLYFKGEQSNQTRIRQRGTPISYALSTFCGEAILFAMDFAVNQKTGGCFLFRIHDDIWLWDAKSKRCAAGWAEMQKFADLTGLKLNMSKTGSAVVGGGDTTGLPPGDIRWGFLEFDASRARFVIDQKEIDLQIIELRRQLNATKSVFGWVNVLNKYMAFFHRNCGGGLTYAFGHDHFTDVVDTLARTWHELVPGTEGGAVGHLRRVIKQKWDVDGLPLGYFYFPIEQGGLGLHNPMFDAYACIKSFEDPEDLECRKEPQEEFKDLLEKEVEDFEQAREQWEQEFKNRDRQFETFFTLEQYTSLREHLLKSWGSTYGKMFDRRTTFDMEETPLFVNLLGPSDWKHLGWYQKWVTTAYGEDLVEKFGGFVIVDPTLIPIGMVKLFKDSRVKLDQ
ncbi:hypothetical protein P691DRAFT_787487 [Macrolepiota fuliginosa MF-IS2]|uniref:Reverse transcriptase domain-containing protein n=1 Tax=Macrolepiota fuliginosa MF-IS2 TaxID=1400762 RepID=A0A9P5XJ40_9AGAR|nr:hypothetical protein P691DRAFT_787487 [Macrolepiota fuliginosa MF-IS2]